MKLLKCAVCGSKGEMSALQALIEEARKHSQCCNLYLRGQCTNDCAHYTLCNAVRQFDKAFSMKEKG